MEKPVGRRCLQMVTKNWKLNETYFKSMFDWYSAVSSVAQAVVWVYKATDSTRYKNKKSFLAVST